MGKQGQRGTYVWVALIGLIVGLLALSGTLGALGSVVLVGAYVALLAAIFANSRLKDLQNMIPVLAASARVTPAARAAVTRARRLSSYNTDETISDVGIIVNEQDRNRRWTRRIAQTVSLDDQALQPYVKLNVPPEHSNRVALIKFEVIDKAGKTQFSRQIEQYVRDGDNLISCDQQLPIRGNDKLGRAGTWDMRVSINGTLAACHSFPVTPATAERRAQLGDDGEARAAANLSAPDEVEANMPLSLEDLLREQRRESSRSSSR